MFTRSQSSKKDKEKQPKKVAFSEFLYRQGNACSDEEEIWSDVQDEKSPEAEGGEMEMPSEGEGENIFGEYLPLKRARTNAKRVFTKRRNDVRTAMAHPEKISFSEFRALVEKAMKARDLLNQIQARLINECLAIKMDVTGELPYCMEDMSDFTTLLADADHLTQQKEKFKAISDAERAAIRARTETFDSELRATPKPKLPVPRLPPTPRRENSDEGEEEPYLGPRRDYDLNATYWEAAPPMALGRENAFLAFAFAGSVVAVGQVPKFTAKSKDWPEFELAWTDFDDKCAAVGKSFFYRLTQLKTVLERDALSLILGLPPHDASYEIAFNLLKKHFTNKQATTNALLRDLETIPIMEKDNKGFLAKVTSIRQTMTALGLDQEEANMTIAVQKVLDKASRHVKRKTCIMQMDLDNMDGNARVGFDDVLSLIETEIKVNLTLKDSEKFDGQKHSQNNSNKNRSSVNSTSSQENKKGKGKNAKSNSTLESEAPKVPQVVHNTNYQPQPDRKPEPRYPCSVCNKKGHFTLDCGDIKRKFPNLKDFQEWVHKERLCKICLVPKHKAFECKHKNKDKFKCRTCNKSGHCTQMHGFMPEKSEPRKSNQASVMEVIASRIVEVPSSTGPIEVAPVLDIVRCLLIVRDEKGNEKSFPIFSFNDSGSQISLLKTSFAKKVGLKGKPENLFINTLHGSKPLDSEKVEFWLQDLNRKYPPISVNALLHPEPLNGGANPLEITSEEWEELKQFKLSYNPRTEAPDEVHLMLGQPYVTLIDRGKIGEAPSGFPIVKETTLGTFLAGGVPMLHQK